MATLEITLFTSERKEAACSGTTARVRGAGSDKMRSGGKLPVTVPGAGMTLRTVTSWSGSGAPVGRAELSWPSYS
jgi:hypothetical protein